MMMMANLKDIRRRIKSVKSTQKITQAMRMVAAAKVRRAENKMKNARFYTRKLQEVFATVLEQADFQEFSSTQTPNVLSLLNAKRSEHRVGLLVVSSDRGLCGAYNTNVLRQAFAQIETLLATGKTPVLYLVGNKAINTLKKRYPSLRIASTLNNLGVEPDYRIIERFCQKLVHAIEQNQLDSIKVISTHFINLVSYQVEQKTFLPLDVETVKTDIQALINENVASTNNRTGVGGGTVAKNTTSAKPLLPELLIEPSAQSVLETLLPMYLTRVLYGIILEAIVSELASRMTAMANATDNAKKMIHTLTLQYNKARQAAITQEIMEIVGGAEALVKA